MHKEKIIIGKNQFVINVMDSRNIIPERKIGKGVYTAFVTVVDEESKVTGGLPVTDDDYQIISFNSVDEAVEGTKEFIGH